MPADRTVDGRARGTDPHSRFYSPSYYPGLLRRNGLTIIACFPPPRPPVYTLAGSRNHNKPIKLSPRRCHESHSKLQSHGLLTLTLRVQPAVAVVVTVAVLYLPIYPSTRLPTYLQTLPTHR